MVLTKFIGIGDNWAIKYYLRIIRERFEFYLAAA